MNNKLLLYQYTHHLQYHLQQLKARARATASVSQLLVPTRDYWNNSNKENQQPTSTTTTMMTTPATQATPLLTKKDHHVVSSASSSSNSSVVSNHNNHNKSQCQRRTVVSFRDTCTVQYVEHRSSLSHPEQVWYSSEEIATFHAQARDLCRTERSSAQQQLLQEASSSSCPSLRGLELRISLPRQKRKLLALQCILRAQKTFSSASSTSASSSSSSSLHTSLQLARLARRCTEWATHTAHIQGQRDAMVARACWDDSYYHHKEEWTSTTLASALPTLPVMTPFPLPLKPGRGGGRRRPSTSSTKRTAPPTDNQAPVVERCVRRRLLPAAVVAAVPTFPYGR